MIVSENGCVVKLEHCRRVGSDFKSTEGHALILVDGVDGEIDTYYTTPTSCRAAVAELSEYYARDWAGTGRVFAYRVFSPTYDGVLNVPM